MRVGTVARWIGAAGLGAGLTLAAGVASAEGIYVAQFGGAHGEPTADNATALWYNPASIALIADTSVFIDVNVAFRGMTYEHSLFSPSATSGQMADINTGETNTGEQKLFNVMVIPFIGITHQFGDLRVGAAAYAPFGGSSTYGKNEDFKHDTTYPGAVDGVQRWYAIEGSLTSYFITGAVAYAFDDLGLDIGLSGNAIYTKVSTTRARTLLGNDDPSPAAEGRAFIDASGWDWSFGVGANWQPIKDKLFVGVAYQSRPNIFTKREAKNRGYRLSGTLRTEFNGHVEEQDASFYTDLPDTILAGVRYRVDENWEARIFGNWQKWSNLVAQCVTVGSSDCYITEDGNATGPAVFLNQPVVDKDAWQINVSGSYYGLMKGLEVLAQLGYYANAAPDETLTPALPDWDTLLVRVGGGYEFDKYVALNLSYGQFISFSRDTTGNPGLADTNRFHPIPFNVGPNNGGKYSQWIGLIDVNVEVKF